MMIRVVAILLWCLGGPALAADVTVAASIEPVWSIVATLARDTSIKVVAVPDNLPGKDQTPRAFTRQAAAINKTLATADAVVSITSIWPDDPLYREARAANIRVVHIDAARAFGKSNASVMLMAPPVDDVPWRKAAPSGGASPWVWFSTANLIRMAEIITADLARLAPSDAARLNANLAEFQRAALALRAEFETVFLDVADQSIFVMSDRFPYLLQEFGLFSEGTLVDDDIRWTKEDLEGVTTLLRERQVRVALHHWRPADNIIEAIQRGGAKLLVLDDGEHADGSPPAPPRIDAWKTTLRGNLDALHKALVDARGRN